MFHLSELANIYWRKYLIVFCMFGFALLLIFGNFRGYNFYAKLKSAKEEMLTNDSQTRSIQVVQLFDEAAVECVSKNCTVTCQGDMNGLNNYLQGSQQQCSSIALLISNAYFPEDELSTNWLEGTFNLSSIKISSSKLSGIQNGAFNQQSLVHVSELELNDVAISALTENTFEGLKAIETFTLVNRIEIFSGEAFLKPMMRTLKKLVIKHVSNTATDPGPWLCGESFPELKSIVFDGSNFGEYINAATFDRLKQLSILKMNSCNITKIAEGSFDFIMKREDILISLKNNLLKRLAGKYLSTINSLRRLYIQNNPWDCTCELEHLSRVFKDCPGCFGEDSKCRTPPHLSGKLLNEIYLERCEDEPSFQWKATTTNTTIKYANTTPSSQNRATTISADSIFIECAGHKLRYTSYLSNFIELSPPDEHFTITSISENSIRLAFEGPTDDLAVIWFYEQPSLDYHDANVRLIGEIDVGCQSELDISFLVEGLIVNQSYTFCLVKNGTKAISPFNCKSYFSAVSRTVEGSDTIWLRLKDRPMAIGIFVGSISISIFLGLIGMFILIRYNPWLLRTNKQTEVDNKENGQDQLNKTNPLTESSFGKSTNSEAPAGHFRRFSTESGLSYMMANNYEELEYYRKTNVSLVFSNRVPKSPAPPLPKRIIAIEDVKGQTLEKGNIYMKDNDDGYTSVV